MNFTRVDAALEDCEHHLETTLAFGTEIEAILTVYVSAVIYAAFEAQVRRTLAARVASSVEEDGHIGNFATYASIRLVRSIKIGELAGAAAWFHEDCKAQFHRELDDEAHAAWNNIVSNRHAVAHEDDSSVVSNMTFRELKAAYPKALTVLDCLAASIAQRGDIGMGASGEVLADADPGPPHRALRRVWTGLRRRAGSD
jgi:hypothetical protein